MADLVEKKLKWIKDYYKKNQMYLELMLINYESCNLYFRIDYIKKLKVYKISWYDLNEVEDKDISKYESMSFIREEYIKNINDDFLNFLVSSQYHSNLDSSEFKVILNANIKTGVDNSVNVEFYKYLPNSLWHLRNLFIFIFDNLPRKFENFLFELLAEIMNNTAKYEYKNEFEFDLFNDDIDKIFAYQIGERGKKYYEEDRVLFLEKIDDRYFAIVGGKEIYLVIIKYDEINKLMQVYCSCPCEFYCKHMYAVILAIRNKRIKKFFKIRYQNPDQSLLDRITNGNYFLCLGMIDNGFLVINAYGELERLPLLDIDGNYNFEIIEDHNKGELAKHVKKVLKEINRC